MKLPHDRNEQENIEHHISTVSQKTVQKILVKYSQIALLSM